MISRRARFALHGLIFLAKVGSNRPLRFRLVMDYLRSWSHDLALSSGYVAKIFQDLARAGLVRSMPGRHGGYLLARDPGGITMDQVLFAIDGPPSEECCVLAVGTCDLKDRCGVSGVLDEARQAYLAVLRREDLASLSRRLALPEDVAKSLQKLDS